MCEEITIQRQLFDYVCKKYYSQIVDSIIYETFV